MSGVDLYPGPRATTAVVCIESARLEVRGSVSPYVKIILGKTEKKTTSKRGRTPVWKETLTFTYSDEPSLKIHVFGNVLLGSDDYIGIHDLNLFPILQAGRSFSGEIPLSSKKGRESGHVTLSINFFPIVNAEPPAPAPAAAAAAPVAAAPVAAAAPPAPAPAAAPPVAAAGYGYSPQIAYPQQPPVAYPQQAAAQQQGQTTVIIVPGGRQGAVPQQYGVPPQYMGMPPPGYPVPQQPPMYAPPSYNPYAHPAPYGVPPYYG